MHYPSTEFSSQPYRTTQLIYPTPKAKPGMVDNKLSGKKPSVFRPLEQRVREENPLYISHISHIPILANNLASCDNFFCHEAEKMQIVFLFRISSATWIQRRL